MIVVTLLFLALHRGGLTRQRTCGRLGHVTRVTVPGGQLSWCAAPLVEKGGANRRRCPERTRGTGCHSSICADTLDGRRARHVVQAHGSPPCRRALMEEAVGKIRAAADTRRELDELTMLRYACLFNNTCQKLEIPDGVIGK